MDMEENNVPVPLRLKFFLIRDNYGIKISIMFFCVCAHAYIFSLVKMHIFRHALVCVNKMYRTCKLTVDIVF